MLMNTLQAVLVAGIIAYCALLYKSFRKQAHYGRLDPNTSMLKVGVVGAIANFLDTLGIGSFAIKTAFYKQFKMIDDRVLPGTLNGQCVLPTMTQALLFIGAVPVDPLTLISMIVASAVGAAVGAKYVANWNRQLVRLVMSISLLIVGILILAGLMGWFPLGGEKMGLTGLPLLIGIAGNFVFGALMTVGIGLYAPCMTLVYLLGMNPMAAFPIMMGSCAILSVFSSGAFMRQGAFDAKAVLVVAIAGPIAVVVAATLVQNMNLEMLKWLLTVVVFYTAITMYRSWQSTEKLTAQRLAKAL
ncbi:sulfite exporter TauE/SafE family protein [Aliagarivorans taiwanensis]|uniref:sulfite exporter TauE/SafE family protein n=1 Tax=Aliagarivorans taiwanensis TaxID=561966 RepID=UPI00040F2FDE|nr:sulfite exporter TauE/SafE family protein [Aliagarivorans taiwanensis]